MQIRDWSQYRVRMPPELHSKIVHSARENWRSMNAEVVMILEKHYAENEKGIGAEFGDRPDASTTE